MSNSINTQIMEGIEWIPERGDIECEVKGRSWDQNNLEFKGLREYNCFVDKL